MKLKSFFLIICLGSFLSNYAQTRNENPVMFDPLFWKEKLKLDGSQSQQIRDINYEYYKGILDAYHKERDNRPALQLIAAQSLQNRSQRIWETLYPKQRKKWKKIWRDRA